MNTLTSVCIKILLVIYAGLIASAEFLPIVYIVLADGIFTCISLTASFCYIFYLKTRSIIERTILDRNESCNYIF